MFMGKIYYRITHSQRGETFNLLIWPYFITTIAYGVGFTLFYGSDSTSQSSLFRSMYGINAHLPLVWGILCVLTIVMGFTFLAFNIPPAGKISGLIGFMLWVFATSAWVLDHNWLLATAVGLPNMLFWIWQYLSLSLFRVEEATDIRSMKNYDDGGYDDILRSDDAAMERMNNRGRDRQVSGKYKNEDDGGDESRPL